MDTKELVWIKQRELEIACWKDKLTEEGLSDDDKQVYEKAIVDSEFKLKEGFKKQKG